MCCKLEQSHHSDIDTNTIYAFYILQEARHMNAQTDGAAATTHFPPIYPRKVVEHGNLSAYVQHT